MIKFKNILIGFLLLLGITFYASCKGNDVGAVQNSYPNTVLVQLHNDSTQTQLEEQFVAYALKEQKMVSRPMQIYLFTFDTAKVKDTTLVELLKESALVKEAQTNKELTTREH